MATETGSDDGQPDPVVDFRKLRATGPPIGNSKLGPRSIMEWFDKLAGTIACRSSSVPGPIYSHDSIDHSPASKEMEDEDVRPECPDGGDSPPGLA